MESEQIDLLGGVLRLDNDNGSNAESVWENPFGAATINPNKDDDRCLFQECRTTFSWDSKLPYLVSNQIQYINRHLYFSPTIFFR